MTDVSGKHQRDHGSRHTDLPAYRGPFSPAGLSQGWSPTHHPSGGWESTQRSQVDAEHLTKQLRGVAVEQLVQVPEEELWLIADGSDLRKPDAETMPALMHVRDLDGKLVPGYCTQSAALRHAQVGGILCHRLFSSEEPGFVSESAEVQQALVGELSASVTAKAQAHHLDSRLGL
ncbi:MAG: hypothetical protein ACJ8CB_34200 [Ktedonobacteraceae bacterium]